MVVTLGETTRVPIKAKVAGYNGAIGLSSLTESAPVVCQIKMLEAPSSMVVGLALKESTVGGFKVSSGHYGDDNCSIVTEPQGFAWAVENIGVYPMLE